MTTGTGLDLRRADLRSNVLENPYWITSGALLPAADALDAVLFSFPITKLVAPGYGNNLIVVHGFLFEVVIAITGGTPVCTVGIGSIATDDNVALVTDITLDNFILDADITHATPEFYGPTTGNTSAWLSAMAAGGSFGTPTHITPADTAVLCVVAYMSGVSTAGQARVHMLISQVPSLR